MSNKDVTPLLAGLEKINLLFYQVKICKYRQTQNYAVNTEYPKIVFFYVVHKGIYSHNRNHKGRDTAHPKNKQFRPGEHKTEL